MTKTIYFVKNVFFADVVVNVNEYLNFDTVVVENLALEPLLANTVVATIFRRRYILNIEKAAHFSVCQCEWSAHPLKLTTCDIRIKNICGNKNYCN